MTQGIEAAAASDQIPQSNLTHRYLRAAVDSLLRGGASLVISGLVPMLLARYLGPHDYGMYSIITALSVMMAGLMHLGQNSPLHKLLPEYAVNDRSRAGALLSTVVLITLGIAAIVSLIFLASAPLLAAKFYHDATLTPFLRFCAALIFVTTLLSLASSSAAGMQDFQAYNSTMLLRATLLIGGALGGAIWWGAWGALIGQFVACVVSALWLLQRVARRAHQQFPQLARPSFSRELLQPLGAFVLPAFVMIVLHSPGFWWANSVVARSQGFAQAGMFSAAYGLLQLISLAPFNFYVPALTFLSEAQAATDSATFQHMVLRSVRGMWFLTLPLSLGCALFSPLLIQVFFGPKYLAATSAALLMSLAGLPMALVGLLNVVLTAAGRIWSACLLSFGGLLGFVVTGSLLIPRWGATGAAATFALVYTVYVLTLLLYLRFALQLQLQELWRPAALTIGSGFVAILLSVTCTGLSLYLAAIALLAMTAIIGVLWVCDETERSICELGVAKFRQVVWS